MLKEPFQTRHKANNIWRGLKKWTLRLDRGNMAPLEREQSKCQFSEKKKNKYNFAHIDGSFELVHEEELHINPVDNARNDSV